MSVLKWLWKKCWRMCCGKGVGFVQGIEDFPRTTHPPAEPFFGEVLESLITEQNALFKGPYVTLKLPFRSGKNSVGHFPDIPMRFSPFRHQERAYERLKGAAPRSTLIATGTGSGKTECFLYPLLDYCHRHRGEPGVKAIIIYPMNALATDQARRFASETSNNSALNGNVSAGLFIGGLDKDEGQKAMSDDMVITDAESMRNYPPDILMANYKMLDYLLLRPRDYRLWQGNRPESLKFVVIDELHTFDGAQGTDLPISAHFSTVIHYTSIILGFMGNGLLCLADLLYALSIISNCLESMGYGY